MPVILIFKIYPFCKFNLENFLYKDGKMKFLRNIFAFLLIPAVGGAGYIFIKSFLYFTVLNVDRYIPFWIGILCYIVFQVILYKPMKTYMFGHELSHAIAGILSGAKIKKFDVGKESGSIALTKDNIWITLAPYFFPIYTSAVIIIYIFLGWFINIKQFYGYFLFLAGFSIAFHVALTIYILSIEQSDLKIYGTFFSYVIIFMVNIAVFVLLAALVFPDDIDVKDIFLRIFDNIADIYKFIGVLEIWSTS
ncbi:hypothetical protein AGMMS5026_08460 [Endomicrobiia bacterium]|uniref:hypothetical protein n=1 Tax=Endomicrobium trichonymphae TaxID=1408204 RepID=UPI00221D4616|nr:hypothetical protein AGMMS49523_03460 [Endomicrobiia bacterium]GHT12266.1 hypothetical protein AGMMS49571_03970 [Endomicrobiia bacterium]GHT26181.1 hypothetical protein AGMMS49995_02270 [Endomicrobiia bacterium]GHT31693.1 hypothetical protein AGMMS5026_08460 [Endomicrobiia bacterium]GMO51108.1 MAG: hypothetical protein Ta2C_00410 [Candidatus Endomicrobium trichonymphae]